MKNALALVGVFSFAGGVLLASAYTLPVSVLAFVAFVGIVFLFGWFFGKRDWYLFPFLVLIFLAFGAWRFTVYDTGVRGALEAKLGATGTYSGTVVAYPDVRESTERLTVHLDDVDADVLVVAPRYPEFSFGDMVSFTGKLEHPQPFDTDGGRTFQYDMFLAKDHVSYLVNFAKIEKTGEAHGVLMRIGKDLFAIRNAFTDGLRSALPEPAASLAEGILVGGKQGLGKALLDAFTVAGLLPLIVLSGYNVMIVAEAILIGFGFLRRQYALLLSGITIILFVVMAGAGSSAVRAGLMAVLALFARVTGRTYDALRVLIFVFVMMILWNPYQLMYDPGFQFSFAATLGLIVLSKPLEMKLIKIKHAGLREIVATTLSAQLFVLPLLLYQTGNLSLIAPLANILTLPIVPFAMLFSFVAGLVGMVLPALSVWVGLPAYALLAYIIKIAELSAGLPLAHATLNAFSALLLVPSYAAIAWVSYKLIKSQGRAVVTTRPKTA